MNKKDFEMRPFRPAFREGDLVVVKGTLISGEITFIDWQTLRADVEWEEYDYIACDSFPLWKLKYLYDWKVD